MAATGQQSTGQLGERTDAWLTEPRSSSSAPDTELDSWLRTDGLLTQRLREHCGASFNMQVLRDDACKDTDGLRREVLLCCDSTPCIYAITEVPANTLDAHSWLAELGDEPLGEALQDRADVTRSAFRFALLSPQQLPEQSGATTDVWARRSEFHIGADALTVTEVFLDTLRDCAGNG